MMQPLKLLVVLEALNFAERILWQFSANLEEKLEVVIFLRTWSLMGLMLISVCCSMVSASGGHSEALRIFGCFNARSN